MLHPDTELRFVSEDVGYGVFAKKIIPRGTVTWVQDPLDRIITIIEADKLQGPIRKYLEKYTYRDRSGNYVFCWDLTKYSNHSNNPTSVLTSLGFEIAIRDIQIGEEITNDYATLNITEPFRCAYDDHGEREWVRPEDFVLFHEKWDSQIADAFEFITSVRQPLSEYLSAEMHNRIKAIQEGKERLPSILENRYSFQG